MNSQALSPTAEDLYRESTDSLPFYSASRQSVVSFSTATKNIGMLFAMSFCGGQMKCVYNVWVPLFFSVVHETAGKRRSDTSLLR